MEGELTLAALAGRRSFALLGLLGGLVLIGPSAAAEGYTISTVPGSYASGDSSRTAIAFDKMGNLYIGDGYVVIRLSNGIATTVAGNFLGPGFAGDGGPANAASLGSVNGLAVDAGGNLYIGDGNNQRVRKVSTSGIITTFAGGGSLSGGSEDGGPATNAMLGGISALSFDSGGNLYLADGGLVRKITPGGILTTVAGVRSVENAIVGDGGPATNTLFGLITGLAFDSSGTLYIVDSSDNRVRIVGSDGIVRTFAGSSSGSFSGDGGPANQAGIDGPDGVAIDSMGNVYVSSVADYRVRLVSTAGIISTIAGTGVQGYDGNGDGGPATAANLYFPFGLAVAATGAIYVADGDSVRILSPPSAGTPAIGSSGVQSAGAFGGFSAIAPGSWIEIFGSSLSTNTRSWSGSDFNGVNAPTSLGGTSVTIGGQNAFIDYISAGQVNAQVPSNVGTGAQSVVVHTPGGSSAAYITTVNATQPGLLAPPSFKIGGTQYAVALFSDNVTYVLPPGAIAGLQSRRAQPGDTITFYGVGFGSVIPSIPAGEIVQQGNALALPFQIIFGSTKATVTYDGLAPGAVGSYQFNVVVPSIPTSDAVPVIFTLNGVAGTQTLYLAVQNGN